MTRGVRWDFPKIMAQFGYKLSPSFINGLPSPFANKSGKNVEPDRLKFIAPPHAPMHLKRFEGYTPENSIPPQLV